jgi:hypothetical protein
MKSMTSRELLQAALHHRESEVVPLDLGSTYVSGISLPAYDRLIKHLSLPPRLYKIVDPMQMLCEIDADVLSLLGIDVVGIHSPYNSFGTRNENYRIWQPTPALTCQIPANFILKQNEFRSWHYYPPNSKEPSAVMPEGQMFFDLIPRQESLDIEDLTPEMAVKHYGDQFQRISDTDLDYYEKQSIHLYNSTVLGIVANLNISAFGGYLMIVAPGMTHTSGIRDPKLWYEALLLNQSYIKELFEMQTGRALENLKLLKQASGNRIDAIFMSGTDFGAQDSLLISREVFITLYKPYYKLLNDWIHTHTTWKTLYHSCGSIFNLLDDFVEMGVDILNPVQFSAKNMGLKRLKELYGDKMVFGGGRS